MNMKNMRLILAGLLAVFLVLPAPHQAAAAGPLLLLSGGAGLLDQNNRPLADYSYLQPGSSHRLLPGARAQLASPDGKTTYLVDGPGLLCLSSSGLLTLGGRPVAPKGQAPKPITAPRAGEKPSPPGAGSLMGAGHGKPDPNRGGTCLALVVGCDAYGEPGGAHASKLANARRAAEYFKSLGWRVELLLNPGRDDLRRAFTLSPQGPHPPRAAVFWFSGKGFACPEPEAGLNICLALGDTGPNDGQNVPPGALTPAGLREMISRMQAERLAVVLDVTGNRHTQARYDPKLKGYLVLTGQGLAGTADILSRIECEAPKGSGRRNPSLGSVLRSLCRAPAKGGKAKTPHPGSASQPQDITNQLLEPEPGAGKPPGRP